MFKGWKTVALGLLVAIGPAALDYVGGIDWTALGLSPSVGAILGAAIIAARAVTSSPIGRKPPQP